VVVSRALKRFLPIFLACAPAAPHPVAPHTTGSAPAASRVGLPDETIPLRYDLSLDVDPAKDFFSGHVAIAIKQLAAVEHIVLHARAMKIDRATIDKQPVGTAARFAFGGKEEPEELVLDARTLPGEHTIEIDYTAPFNKQLRGLYKVTQGGKSWAFTQLEAVDARRMFPSFDEPRFKTPFALHVRAPAEMKAISNYPLADRNGGAWNFAPTLPLPTYLVALAVGDLDVTDGPKDPVPIRIITVPGKGNLGALSLDAAAAYLKILGNYFNRPYPYPKLDIAAVPDFGPGAMENAGLVTFREELLLLDPKSAPLLAERRMESVMAHELAHQWFGDLVTMKWWDDIWLNEGFATWMSSKAVDERKPAQNSRAELAGVVLNVMSSDALASARPVRVPVATSDAILESGGWTAYQKGSAVLAMLEAHAGEGPFRDGLRAYIKSHELGTVTSDDLLASLGGTTGKDLSPIARSFIGQRGVPIVDVSCANENIHLAQRPLHALGSKSNEAQSWTIPICMRTDLPAPICLVLQTQSTDVPVSKCPRWIEPNAAQKGYFRWSLPAPMLAALAKEKSLGEEERMALISNTWALVQTGDVDPKRALDVLADMDVAHESSRLVIEQAIALLFGVRDAFVTEENAAAFRAFVVRVLKPALASVGEEPAEKESTERRIARLSITAALFDLGSDASVRATAEARVKKYLQNTSSIDPDLAGLALRISARSGGAATPTVIRERLARATPSERVMLVAALGSSSDLPNALADVLTGAIRAGDFRYLLGAASRQLDSRAAFVAWVMKHYADLGTKLGGVGGLASLVGWTCDRKVQSEVADFFQSRLAKLEGAQRPFDEGKEQSDLCIELRARSPKFSP